MRLARLLAPPKRKTADREPSPIPEKKPEACVPAVPSGKTAVAPAPTIVQDLADKRRYPRQSKDYRVEILDAWERPTDEAVKMVDMSAGGIGIECHQPLHVNQSLHFRMTVEGNNIVDARARVRWTRPMGFRTAVGLEIEGMNFIARHRLEKTLDESPSGKMGLTLALTLVLQFASCLMALCVVADWVRAHPYYFAFGVLASPLFLAVGLAAYTLRGLRRS